MLKNNVLIVSLVLPVTALIFCIACVAIFVSPFVFVGWLVNFFFSKKKKSEKPVSQTENLMEKYYPEFFKSALNG